MGDATKERTIGLMRMRFWKDAVDAMYNSSSVPDHPVATELALAVRRHGLSKQLLDRIISSRESLLERDQPFGSVDEVEGYAHDAFTSINYLLLECLECLGSGENKEKEKSGHVKHVANQLGTEIQNFRRDGELMGGHLKAILRRNKIDLKNNLVGLPF